MSRLGFFRRKKKEEKVEKAELKEKTLLKELCGEDSELYEAISRTVLLNPFQALREGIDSYAQRGAELEEKGDAFRARIMYRVAGELALFEGNTDKVQTFFKKCAETEIDPEMKRVYEFYTKKKNIEKAVGVAKQYYARLTA